MERRVIGVDPLRVGGQLCRFCIENNANGRLMTCKGDVHTLQGQSRCIFGQGKVLCKRQPRVDLISRENKGVCGWG